MQQSTSTSIKAKQRSQTTVHVAYFIKSHEQLMDFYHMKGMQAKKKADRIKFFEMRQKHFDVAQDLIKRYIRDRDIEF